MTEKEEKSMRINTTLQTLYAIHEDLLGASSGSHEEHLRNYINLYVQSHKTSQQIFIVFCEHKFLNRLLKDYLKTVPSLSILQMLNLLISNINKLDHLVYVFSQSIVHQFLFERFNVQQENTEAIEYYCQLLKTIIMKISQTKNDFLIKLFCNQRFPHFPLLTISTILATTENNEILAKITAQQSVLMMINLINIKKVGLVYLNQLQMVIFYYETVRQLLCESTEDDKQGLMRYLIDLIITLKQNTTSLALLFNILTNILFFSNKQNPIKILSFITTLRAQFLQVQESIKDLSEDIIHVLYTIFIKYFCSNYLNYTYYCAQRLIPSLSITKTANLLKFYQKRSLKIAEFLTNQQEYYNNEKEKHLIYEEWIYFNDKNINLSPLQEKKKSKSFQEFFNKSETENYVKNVMRIAGLSFQKIKDPISKLSWSVDFKTSVYLVEYVCKKYQEKPHSQDFITDQEWLMTPCTEFYVQVYKILQQLSKYNVDYFGKRSNILVTEMQGENMFITAIRPHLLSMMVKNLCQHNPLPIKDLSILYRMIVEFKLSEFTQQYIVTLLSMLKQLQSRISQELFQEQNSAYFIKYVIKNREKKILKQKLQSLLEKKGHQVDKKKQYLIQSYLFTYFIIINMLDKSLKSINRIFHEFWMQNFASSDQQQIVSFRHLLKTKDAKGNTIYVQATQKYEFVIQYIQKLSNKMVLFNLNDKDCLNSPKIHPYLSFQEYPENILMVNLQKVHEFHQDIKRIRQFKKEILRNSILQYLELTYFTLQALNPRRKISKIIYTPQ